MPPHAAGGGGFVRWSADSCAPYPTARSPCFPHVSRSRLRLRSHSAAWKALSDADKAPFAKLADKDKKRYAKEMLT